MNTQGRGERAEDGPGPSKATSLRRGAHVMACLSNAALQTLLES